MCLLIERASLEVNGRMEYYCSEYALFTSGWVKAEI